MSGLEPVQVGVVDGVQTVIHHRHNIIGHACVACALLGLRSELDRRGQEVERLRERERCADLAVMEARAEIARLKRELENRPSLSQEQGLELRAKAAERERDDARAEVARLRERERCADLAVMEARAESPERIGEMNFGEARAILLDWADEKSGEQIFQAIAVVLDKHETNNKLFAEYEDALKAKREENARLTKEWNVAQAGERAATMLLNSAQERLALHEQHDDDCPCSGDNELHAYSCRDCTCEIGEDFREQLQRAETAERALAAANAKLASLREYLEEGVQEHEAIKRTRAAAYRAILVEFFDVRLPDAQALLSADTEAPERETGGKA